jgi:serine/threonine protein kinase
MQVRSLAETWSLIVNQGYNDLAPPHAHGSSGCVFQCFIVGADGNQLRVALKVASVQKQWTRLDDIKTPAVHVLLVNDEHHRKGVTGLLREAHVLALLKSENKCGVASTVSLVNCNLAPDGILAATGCLCIVTEWLHCIGDTRRLLVLPNEVVTVAGYAEAVLNTALHITEAVSKMNAAGIAHHDLKSCNVSITAATVIMIDLGAASMAQGQDDPKIPSIADIWHRPATCHPNHICFPQGYFQIVFPKTEAASSTSHKC